MDKKRWATIVSLFLVAASLAYIGVQGWEIRDHLLSWQPGPYSVVLLLAGASLYGIAITPHALAWQYTLNRLTNRRVALLLIFARSQLGKYIPGNVAHIAGRHVMAREYDFPHSSLITSTLIEFSGLLSAAGTIVIFATAIPALEIATTTSFPIPLHLLGFILVCLMPGVALACRIAPDRFGLFSAQNGQQTTAPSVWFLLLPYFFYLCYFLIAGAAFVSVCLAVSGYTAFSFTPLLLIAFSVSWVLGFVTPGAPSGVGIREAVIFFCLQTVLPKSDALLISILFRVVTIAGDVLFWLSVELLKRSASRP